MASPPAWQISIMLVVLIAVFILLGVMSHLAIQQSEGEKYRQVDNASAIIKAGITMVQVIVVVADLRFL